MDQQLKERRTTAINAVFVVILCSISYCLGVWKSQDDTFKEISLEQKVNELVSIVNTNSISRTIQPSDIAMMKDLDAIYNALPSSIETKRKIGIIYDALFILEGRKWEQAITEAVKIADEADKNKSVKKP